MTTWFGGTTGASDSVMGVDTPSGQAFTAPASGNITQARGILGTNATNCNVKVLIYANSGGVPGALLGQSDALALTHPAAMTLRTFTFTTPVAVVSGTSYFLMVFGGPSASFDWKHRRDAGVGTTYYRSPVAYPTPANPFGTASSFGGFRLYLEAGIEPPVTTPVAAFSGTPLTGDAPLNVAFTDTSTNTPTSWAWDFGDSGTSTSQNPSHNYTTPGVYEVELVATNAAGSDAETKTGYVTVTVASDPLDYAEGGGITIS